MADDIDSDTCLPFKRRIGEATVEQHSLSLSSILIPKEDQHITHITFPSVSDSVNIFSKKVKCSPQLDPEEKEHVKEEETVGIADCGLGFSVIEGEDHLQERTYSEMGIARAVEERRQVFETVNGGIGEEEVMVEEVRKDLAKGEVGVSAIQEVCEEKKSVVEVQMGSFVQVSMQDSVSCAASSDMVWKNLSKNEEEHFLVESEDGPITEVEAHLEEVTDFGSSGETLGDSAKIEEGFEIDEKGCGNHTSDVKEVNKIVEKVDGLKGIDGSNRCSLKIEVIDETALIESVSVSKTGNGCGKGTGLVGFAENTGRSYKKNGSHEMDEKKEKRPRRKGKGAKKISETNEKQNVLTHIAEARNGCAKNGGEGKRVYSRKELEVLRFVNVEKQRKMWHEVYCGLGPAVAKEYDDLVNCKNQKHIRLNFDPRQRFGKKEEAPAILGAVCSENVDNEIEYMKHNGIENVNPLDSSCGHSITGEEGCTVPDEECGEDGESDEDYDSIQRPAFFVEGEPDFDSGPPQDGLEYLRRVRWEAAQIPKVQVAKLDRSKLNKEQTVYMPKIPDIARCLEHLLPLKQWEDVFLADFSELRLALSCLEASSAGGSKQQSISISHESSGNYPTLSAILGMDSVARVSMLRRRISSLETTGTLSRSDCVWLFALCAAVDTPLDADTSAALRCMLRKCASLRAEKSELDDEIVMLSILATISGRYFGQLEN